MKSAFQHCIEPRLIEVNRVGRHSVEFEMRSSAVAKVEVTGQCLFRFSDRFVVGVINFFTLH